MSDRKNYPHRAPNADPLSVMTGASVATDPRGSAVIASRWAYGTLPLKLSRYPAALKAVTVEPDPRLHAIAGGRLGWSYAARVPASASAPALAWARATFEEAPLPMRVFLVVGWMGLVLEGGPGSDATRVLGWPIAQSTLEVAVLKRRSRLGRQATLLFTAQPEGVTFSSAMVFTTRLGRIVWSCRIKPPVGSPSRAQPRVTRRA